MDKRNGNILFNAIAPIYGLFYKKQKKSFEEVVEKTSKIFDVTLYDTVIDVGCGTGAFCSVLNAKGLCVTGIDPAERMLNHAKKQPENKNIEFVLANVLERLPFEDKSFDISIASYVAHGMKKSDRKKMYSEMSRVTKNRVIIHDYNQNRSFMTSLIEWFERGDYFRFIKMAKNEMKECFSEVIVIDVDTQAAWYICTP